MNEKRLTEYDVQFVNRHYVRFGQFIESKIEPLAEGNRMEQRYKCKRSRTAYMSHLTKQINSVSDLMSDYSKEFKIWKQFRKNMWK